MRKKFYLTLDTETATLPFANEICHSAKQKQTIAIAKPLVYDIGWVITDRQGNIVKEENFLVQETFFVPNVFNTAYYCDKRPIYMDLYQRGEIIAKPWNDIIEILLEDLRQVDISCAYNACFDFKKAIPYTEKYIENLYSTDYNKWEKGQRWHCGKLLEKKNCGNNKDYLNPVFQLRGEEFPIADLWAISCDRLINIDKYRNYCLDNELWTASIQYFKTSAETSFQYLSDRYDFIEDHTALSDAKIEAFILTKALKKGAVLPELKAFPFRELGTTIDYTKAKRRKSIKALAVALNEYLDTLEEGTGYYTRVQNMLFSLYDETFEN